jgi:hypothetical protein
MPTTALTCVPAAAVGGDKLIVPCDDAWVVVIPMSGPHAASSANTHAPIRRAIHGRLAAAQRLDPSLRIACCLLARSRSSARQADLLGTRVQCLLSERVPPV